MVGNWSLQRFLKTWAYHDVILNSGILLFQDIYTRGKSLADSAAQLSDTKECNPEEIGALATEFEKELTEFTNRITTRKELLEMATNFFKCTDQVFNYIFYYSKR